jgi:hypothetical protein
MLHGVDYMMRYKAVSFIRTSLHPFELSNRTLSAKLHSSISFLFLSFTHCELVWITPYPPDIHVVICKLRWDLACVPRRGSLDRIGLTKFRQSDIIIPLGSYSTPADLWSSDILTKRKDAHLHRSLLGTNVQGRSALARLCLSGRSQVASAANSGDQVKFPCFHEA